MSSSEHDNLIFILVMCKMKDERFKKLVSSEIKKCG